MLRATVCFSLMFACASISALAGQATIGATIDAYARAFSTCDPAALAAVSDADGTGFGVTGTLGRLDDGSLKRQCDAGVRFTMKVLIVDSVEGATQAFAAVMTSGTVKTAGGRTLDNPLRISFVLTRNAPGDTWRIRHTHISALQPIK